MNTYRFVSTVFVCLFTAWLATGPIASTPAHAKAPPAPADVAAPPDTAQKTESGLASRVLERGTGKEHPGPTDHVKVHYTGWTTDGKMFDSSVSRGQPANFPLDRVIPGWTEGLQLMVEGEKRRLWIPVELAYNNLPGRPKGMLVFDVELLEILRPPEVPPDVAGPPEDAQKSESGLAWKVLQKGPAKRHPKTTDIVSIHFTGWTTDGKMFDSSVMRGEPLRVPMNSIIAGWAEPLQSMVVGEKRRLWMPPELADRGTGQSPPGVLVFDLELLGIIKPPDVPPDVAAIPENATKLESGLASRVLAKGTGKVHPKADSTVRVRYAGWTTDGNMIDTTALRGGPMELDLGRMIPGWIEGLQLMVEGETRRFWIPGKLAYEGQVGRPQGMLVFDVELVAIVE